MTFFIFCSVIIFGAQALAQTIELPHHCLGESRSPCAVQTLERNEFQWSGKKFRAAPQAKILFLDSEQLQLIEGKVWLLGMDGEKLKFGEVEFILHGDVLVSRQKERLSIMTLAGIVHVSGPLGKSIPVPAGFQNWYQGLDAKAQVEQGVISAFELKSFMADWLHIVGSHHRQYSEKITQYRADQKLAVEASSKLYKDVLQIRQVASENDEKIQLQQMRRVQEEQMKFRKMFRQKYFQDGDPQS